MKGSAILPGVATAIILLMCAYMLKGSAILPGVATKSIAVKHYSKLKGSAILPGVATVKKVDSDNPYDVERQRYSAGRSYFDVSEHHLIVDFEC